MRVTVMTYNVHSCIGSDGKLSPERVAAVVARSDADIVGLQELDAGLARTGRVHQAEEIARILRMEYRFHPSLRLEEGGYGNAVLCRFPMTLRKAGELPTREGRRLERRGALWVEVRLPHARLDVLFTHLGLDRRERLLQARGLAGPEWLGHPGRHRPVVFGGDLNAVAGSAIHRIFTATLRDVARGERLRSWPSRYPLLDLDHLFVGGGIVVRSAELVQTAAARAASDHLPLVAEVFIP